DRRYKSAKITFEHTLKESNVELPQNILSGIDQCVTADANTDNATLSLEDAFKAFSQRSPKLVSVLVVNENTLGQEIMKALEIGNPVDADNKRSDAVDVFAGYLDDLRNALMALMLKVNERMDGVKNTREFADNARKELIAAIDEFLSSLPSQSVDMEQVLNLLNSISEGQNQQRRMSKSLIDEGEDVSDGDEYRDEFAEMQEKMEDDVLQHANFNDDLKGDLINEVDADAQLVNKILELERERQKDALTSALAIEIPESEDENAIDEKHATEKEELEKKLELERSSRLNALMRSNTAVEISDDERSVYESKVVTLSSTRYAVKMRHLGALARIKFFSLNSKFKERRCDKLRQYLYNENRTRSASSPDVARSPSASNLGRSPSKSNMLRLHSSRTQVENRDVSLEKLMTGLFEEESADIERLYSEIVKERTRVEDFEGSIREKWLNNLDDVDIEHEVTVLKKERENDFSLLKSELDSLFTESSQLLNDELSVTTEFIRKRISHFDDTTQNEILNFVEIESQCRKEYVSEGIATQKLILEDVGKKVDEIISLATSWGPMVDMSSQLSNLHDRMIVALHSYHDGCMRLQLGENSLRAEAAEMKLFSDLNRQGATEHEISRFVHDQRENEKMDTSLLIRKLSMQFKKEIEDEKSRQEGAATDYERELVLASEMNAARELKLLVMIEKSRRSILGEVITSLLAKKEFMVSLYRNKNLPEYVVKNAEIQIDAEIQREECELNAAYSSLATGMLLTQQHAACMVEGIEPNLAASFTAFDASHCKQMSYYRESFSAEILRRTQKIIISGHAFREFESKRLLSLNRPAEELTALYDSIDETIKQDVEEAEKSTGDEFRRMESQVKEHTDDKKKVLNSYSERVQNAKDKYISEQEATLTKYELDRVNVRQSLCDNDGLLESTLLSIDQKAAGALAACSVSFHAELCAAFQSALTHQLSLEKVEDNIREMRNRKQQEVEALENSMELLRIQKLEDLIKSQRERRQEVASKRAEHERNLVGLEEQLKHRRESANKHLQNKLAMRRQIREAELREDGLNQLQAKQVAQAESETYEQSQERDLNNFLQDEERSLRDSIHKELDNAEAELARRLELFKSCINGGLDEFREKEKHYLSEEASRQRSVIKEGYITEGYSPEEAEAIAAKRASEFEINQGEAIEDFVEKLDEETMDRVVKEADRDLSRCRKGNAEKKRRMREKLSEKKAELKRKKSDEMAKRRSGRERELQESGTSEAEAKMIAEAELSSQEIADMREIEDMLSAEEKAALETIDEETALDESNIMRTRDDTLAALRDGLAAVNRRKRKELDEQLRQKRITRQKELEEKGLSEEDAESIAEEECAIDSADLNALDQEMRKVKDNLLAAVNDEFADRVLQSRLDYEKAINGLEVAFEVKKAAVKSATQERLKKRREQRKRELLSRSDKPLSEVEAQVAVEFEDEQDILNQLDDEIENEFVNAVAREQESISKFESSPVEVELKEKEDKESQELRSRLLKDEKEYLSREEQDSYSSAAAARDAAKRTLEEAEERVGDLRKQYEEEIIRLQNEMLELKRKEIEAFEARLKQESSTHESELQTSGVGDDEMRTKLEEARAIDEKRRQELTDRLNKEEIAAVESKKKELDEKIRKELDAEYIQAAEKAALAASERSNAQNAINSLREQHEAELRRLRDQLASDRKAQCSNLKSRLNKKAKRKKQLDSVVEEIEVSDVEADAVEPIQNNEESETSKLLTELEEKHAQEMEAALLAAREKELEAAAAAAREAALETERALKTRAEEEANQRKVQRLHEILEKEDKKRLEGEAAKIHGGKERLENRLAEKRARKERELKEQ
ncbi:MAG: hypothetical protein CL799_02655, partial [Chromatiales bacterium]|nr:hypothetical protein [Chromatiales bacterium]